MMTSFDAPCFARMNPAEAESVANNETLSFVNLKRMLTHFIKIFYAPWKDLIWGSSFNKRCYFSSFRYLTIASISSSVIGTTGMIG